MAKAKSHPRSKNPIRGLPDRLRHVVAETHGGKVSAFARALDIQTSQVSYWLSGNNNPAAAHLRRIGLLTGYSIDWILGFKGPQKRDEREEIGDFARHLRRALHEHVEIVDPFPGIDSDWSEELEDGTLRTPMESGAELASAVAESYWLVRRQRSGDKWAPSFHALAVLMRKDAERALQRDWWGLAFDLRNAARAASGYAYLLESKTVDWQDILDLAPWPLEFMNSLLMNPTPIPKRWTTFGVTGGVRGAGLAVLGNGIETVWWVDSNTGEARRDSARSGFSTTDNPMNPEDRGHWATNLMREYRAPGLERTAPRSA
jgi:transcriptional regulator with XRE-family HTH domain